MAQNRTGLVETRVASIELLESGVVRVTIKEGMKQSVADATANVAGAREAGAGVIRPLLVDISRAETLEPEVRRYYSASILADSFSAFGLLTEASPVGVMVGNVYLRLARHSVPMRLFVSEQEAFAWLTRYR